MNMSALSLFRVIAFLLLLLPLGCANSQSRPPREFVLWSWALSTGEYRFAVFPETEEQPSLRNVQRDPRNSVDLTGLKRALSNLPQGAVVAWRTHPDYQMTYPASSVVEEVKRFAKARTINLQVLPMLIENEPEGL